MAEWEYGIYPTEADIDGLLPGMWILEEDGKILGCLATTSEPVPGYESIPWTKEEGTVLHLVALLPALQGKGLMKGFLQSVMEKGKISSIHLDCIKTNAPAISFYKKFGFSDLGEHAIWYPDTGWESYRMFEYFKG